MAEVDEVLDSSSEPEDSSESKSRFGFRPSESIIHAIDRQIVSSGLRLIMFLPAFAAFTYFATWAFLKIHLRGGPKILDPMLA